MARHHRQPVPKMIIAHWVELRQNSRMSEFQCLSPADGSSVYDGRYADAAQRESALADAAEGQVIWAKMPLDLRIEKLKVAVAYLYKDRDRLGRDISRQMGRPVQYSAGELAGLKERCDMMLHLAPDALVPLRPDPVSGFDRWIDREPLGIVVVMAPWNYPYLTAVNAIVPALAAGNAVVLKHSVQTPLAALAFQDAFDAAGLPHGAFQHLFLDHDGAAKLVQDHRVDFLAFTGSVAGGHAVMAATAERFIGVGLELGGKDPAYVRADCDLAFAAENIAEGAFFNSGQSCCAVERVYVHASIFDDFVAAIIPHVAALKLGDPMDAETSLGPCTSVAGADFVRNQVADAIAAGAKAHLPMDTDRGSAYLSPQILTNVTHDMDVMTQESFGPVVGIMPVADDSTAVDHMNDSQYGLTASIWTRDERAAEKIGRQIETGTVFCNRCDYLDPALAWTGVKDSGRGCTLSSIGYEHLTRPKSYHFKRHIGPKG